MNYLHKRGYFEYDEIASFSIKWFVIPLDN